MLDTKARPQSDDSAGLAETSQAKLIWRRFRRHRLAVVCLVIILMAYVGAIFCEFFAPHGKDVYRAEFSAAPPQTLHVGWDGGPKIFVYGYNSEVNQELQLREFSVDKNHRIELRLFAVGDPYKMWGLIPSTIHIIGPSDPNETFFLLGSDSQGRDLLSRIIYGARVSLSIGLLGVSLSLFLGIVVGGLSGYFAGTVDVVLQRVIEFIMSIPALPLWLGLAAAVPPGWGTLKTYFAITVILSLIGWTGLARVIRGRFLQIRSEDYVVAARLDGAGQWRVIFRQILPAFTSHIIATLTLAIPGMILAETALSFLGLGIQAPAVSWGSLLQDAQNLRVVATAPWLLLPGMAVVIIVVSLNFVGDGLRDAADPFSA